MNKNEKLMPESCYSLDTEMSFDKINRAKDTDDFLAVKVISWDYKSQCLKVDLGNDITGIIPLSEFTIYPTKRHGMLSPSVYAFISKIVCACVIDITHDNIILSRKKNMLKALDSLRSNPNETIFCKITNIENYGVFTDIGHGLSGLMHITEIATSRINKPEDLGLAVGQLIDSKIISINDTNYHISLSQKDIFNDITNIYNVGDVIYGTILDPVDEIESGYFTYIHPVVGGIMDSPSEEKIPYGTRVSVLIKGFHKKDPRKAKLAFVEFEEN